MHVVLLHAYDQFATASIWQLPSWTLELVKAGAVAVSVFFILSGFILSYNYLDHDFRQGETRRGFWIARFARIYPVYLFGLILAAPKFFSGLSVSQDPVGSGLKVVAAVTLTQAWIPDFALAWNAPGWSLSTEAFFYLLFPAAALLVNRFRSKRILLLAMAACWGAALLPPVLSSTLDLASPTWSSFFKFNPIIRLSEFLLGICLGKFFLLQSREPRPSSNRVSLSLVLLLGTLGVALCCRAFWPKLLLHNGLLDPLFAALILALAQIDSMPGALQRVLSGRGLLLLGQSSYALYILHAPVKGLFFGTVKRVAPVALADPFLSSLVFLTYLLLALLVAIATFKFLEEPARRLFKRRFAPKRIASLPEQLRPARATDPSTGLGQALNPLT